MIKADHSHKSQVLDILSDAFDANISVNYIVKQDAQRKKRLSFLMSYSFDMCMEMGAVYLSEDMNACALLLYPEKKKTSVKALSLDVQLVLKTIGIGRIPQILKRESAFKPYKPKAGDTYLWFIGVKTSHQGIGVGGRLLGEIVSENDKMQRSIYLETSMQQNLAFYERLGFVNYASLQEPHTIYFIKRLHQ